MDLLATAIDAARAGGERLLEGLARSSKDVTMKSARANIVTWADEASSESIFQVITAACPDHAILGEEGNGGNPDGPYTWIVDPLDGTANYARELSPWGVSIAVRQTDGPLLVGVLWDPLREEMFVAELGQGSEFDCGGTDDIRKALIATGLQNDDPAAIREHCDRVEQIHLHCRGMRAIGCPSFAMAYVAVGKIDGFVEKDATYAWDVAAASLLLSESGGLATDFDGGPINLGPGISNVIASNATIHADLLDIINMRRR